MDSSQTTDYHASFPLIIHNDQLLFHLKIEGKTKLIFVDTGAPSSTSNFKEFYFLGNHYTIGVGTFASVENISKHVGTYFFQDL